MTRDDKRELPKVDIELLVLKGSVRALIIPERESEGICLERESEGISPERESEGICLERESEGISPERERESICLERERGGICLERENIQGPTGTWESH